MQKSLISRRGKEMITNSRILQFNRPDLCKETILVRLAHLTKFKFQRWAKKTQNKQMTMSQTKATHLMATTMAQRQMLSLMMTPVLT